MIRTDLDDDHDGLKNDLSVLTDLTEEILKESTGFVLQQLSAVGQPARIGHNSYRSTQVNSRAPVKSA